MTDFTEANRKYFEYSPFERCSVGQVRTLILFFFLFTAIWQPNTKTGLPTP